jgi:hypothetical protein
LVPANAVIAFIVGVINVVVLHGERIRFHLNPGARPLNVTHASGHCYQEHGTQHESGFVGLEEKFFDIHGMRIIPKTALALWGVTLPADLRI